MTSADDMPSARDWIDQSQHLATSRGHRVSYRRTGKGPTVVMLHGFPTWSYDYVAVAADLQRDHDVITLDFLGYGSSDKPRRYHYSVAENADTVEELCAHLGLTELDLVIHDYGSIVGQELLDRERSGVLSFAIRTLTVFNGGISYAAYRPTTLQKLLKLPVLGGLIAGRISADRVRVALDAVRGEAKLTDAEFAEIWVGMSHDDGHKLANLLIRYNDERAEHHARWESAMSDYGGPLHLIWGLDDPVSGKHVLDTARIKLPTAKVTELAGVGHFPMAEAPDRVIAALRKTN